jgi:hypothetical protein
MRPRRSEEHAAAGACRKVPFFQRAGVRVSVFEVQEEEELRRLVATLHAKTEPIVVPLSRVQATDDESSSGEGLWAEASPMEGGVGTAASLSFYTVATKVCALANTSFHASSGKDDLDAPLMTRGLTSLHATGFVSSLNAAFGVSLPATLVFESGSIRAIAYRVLGVDQPQTTRLRTRSPGRKDAAALLCIIGRWPGQPRGAHLVLLAAAGGDASTEVPTSRWSAVETPSSAARHGGFIANAHRFDHLCVTAFGYAAAWLLTHVLELAWQDIWHLRGRGSSHGPAAAPVA